MLEQAHAHSFSGDLILTYGLEGAAIGRVYKQYDDEYADGRHEHRHEGREGHLRAAYVEGEVREPRIAAQHVRAVRDRAEFLPLEDSLYYLGEAQSSDRKIVALEPEHRQTDEPGEEGGHDAGQQHRQQCAQYHARRSHGLQPENAVYCLLEGEIYRRVIVLIHTRDALRRYGEDCIGICAYQHEARLPQREQAGETVEQVHRHRNQSVHRALAHDRDEHVELRSGGDGLIHPDAQRVENNEADRRYQQLCEFTFLRIHASAPLRPCPLPSRRRVRWA